MAITMMPTTTTATTTTLPLSSSCPNLHHPFAITRTLNHYPHRKMPSICCKNSSSSSSVSATVSMQQQEEEQEEGAARIGAKVRVKVPLKVYHVPRVPDGVIDLDGMEGELKDYVAIYKGKRISANLPFKVQFVTHVEGRGPVKFFAHLKEDEFEYLD